MELCISLLTGYLLSFFLLTERLKSSGCSSVDKPSNVSLKEMICLECEADKSWLFHFLLVDI